MENFYLDTRRPSGRLTAQLPVCQVVHKLALHTIFNPAAICDQRIAA